ncbi:MAG: hypothetical protein ABJQ34_00665, partial [Paracoccaceae bacterium]
ASLTSDFIIASLLWIVTLGPSGVWRCLSASPLKGVLELLPITRNPFFIKNVIFFHILFLSL